MRPTARLFFTAIAALAIAAPLVATQARPDAAEAASVTWASGASGGGVTTGELSSWRGRSLDIAGTWSDDNANSVGLWQLRPGGQYAGWNKALDIAVGALDPGETWEAAASGAYDARWRQSLATLRSLRSSSKASTYIRFAHEMNGNWYPWSVNEKNYTSFVSAWKRYRAIQKAEFPTAKLVFNVNRDSVGTGMDWRQFFPGKKYVDVLSVDYYNSYPYVSTDADWSSSLTQTDQWGAPKGLSTHLAFAKSQGLPFSISEWSGNARFGDSPAFVSGLLGYVKSHAGWQNGQIRYEILFNSQGYNGQFSLMGNATRMPDSSSAYRAFFTSAGIPR